MMSDHNTKIKTKRHPAVLPVLLILAAAALIVFGILAGQPDSVLAKAASICLECIGIGF